MNLKEAFRYSNHITEMFDEIKGYFFNRRNFQCVTKLHMKSVVDGAIENTMENDDYTRPYEDFSNDTILGFAASLINEKNGIAVAIAQAKAGCPIDIDACVTANNMRHNAVSMINNIVSSTKPAVVKEQGKSYRININGDQTPYFYDIESTHTPTYTLEFYRELSKAMAKRADETSSMIERAFIETEVDFEPRYDVNDSVEDSIRKFELTELTNI